MSMNVGGKKGSIANINITPYIDILLVLLIIFMVITPVRQLDLEVKVPQTSDPNDAKNNVVDPSVIVVSINEAMGIEINGQRATMGDLRSKLQEIYNKRANKNMFVNASAKLPYGDIVKIIDIAKGAGVGDIGLLTEQIR
jgi:biopolymer transport protein TolR